MLCNLICLKLQSQKFCNCLPTLIINRKIQVLGSSLDRDKLAKGVQINHNWFDSFILGRYGWNICFGVLARSPRSHVRNFWPPLNLILVFDSSKEASWCTDYNTTNQNSFQWTILEKVRLDRQRGPQKIVCCCCCFISC